MPFSEFCTITLLSFCFYEQNKFANEESSGRYQADTTISCQYCMQAKSLEKLTVRFRHEFGTR
jgi:hypothetical protein